MQCGLASREPHYPHEDSFRARAFRQASGQSELLHKEVAFGRHDEVLRPIVGTRVEPSYDRHRCRVELPITTAAPAISSAIAMMVEVSS